MNKICCVVQRYGLEVNGGAELLTRQFAERLSDFYNVEVLTSKAIDYETRRDEYTNDEEIINNVLVKRFGVTKKRIKEDFKAYNDKMFEIETSFDDQELFVYKQGPFVPGLLRYLEKHQDEYDVILLFTYLYYPSVKAINIASHKTIVVPFAHDEPYIDKEIYKDLFTKAKAFIFETDEERNLIRDKFLNYHIPYIIAGSGIDVPEIINENDFKTKYNIDDYIIYVGRIDEGKNCKELFDYFLKYKKNNPSNLKLVLLGKNMMSIPNNKDIISLGFVSEEDKFNGIKGSKLLVLPSKYESLSIVVLEAFSLNTPVLVNKNADVLKGHCDKSEGGFYYDNYEEFKEYLDRLLNDEGLNNAMGKNGHKYINDNFRWPIIIRKIRSIIEYVIKENQ